MSDNCCPPSPVIEVGLPGPPGPEGPEGPAGPQGPPGDPQALNPASCNAAQNTPAGLLVPSTNVVPMAAQAPAPVGANRSADIVVANPGGCPDTWQIGARLSPVSGQAVLAANRNLPANNTWVNVAVAITLPEPGRYLLTWDAQAALCVIANNSSNRFIQVRVQNATTGAVFGGTVRTPAQHQFSMDVGSSMQACNGGFASITHIVGTATPITLRMQGLLGGNPGTLQQGLLRAGQTKVTMTKFSD